MYKMVSLQTNASKVALAGLLAVSLCGGSMMVGASTAYAGEVTIGKTATETDANALSYNAFKLFNATKNDDGSVSRGLSRSLCKSFHRNLSILALMPSSHSSWLRTRAQPGWWHPSPHLE
ncbi:hypothetical protein [Slackia isoflavoniconvertens]|uniref:hypothetical protein n=1 Tax=Slackia isoflavoniconvertens TaxID=572010 RepID=UPI003AB9B4CC